MEFSFGGFIFGAIAMIIGILMVRFYKEIADNLTGGVSTYDKVRMWGLGIAVFGVLTMFGIIQWLLILILSQVFPQLR
ncbi:MAG: hypothetical protein KIG14_02135 [Candidatus Sacchiramonaceae bacterium]|nr:hypothetical protein [Candidatus Saccharimonadaceae bacterium]